MYVHVFVSMTGSYRFPLTKVLGDTYGFSHLRVKNVFHRITDIGYIKRSYEPMKLWFMLH